MTQASQTPPYDPALEGTPREFKCLTCLIVIRAPHLPQLCPRCGASRVKLVEIRGGVAADAEQ